MNYLYTNVGKGNLRRTDILYTFKYNIRQDFEEIINQVLEYKIKHFKEDIQQFKEKHGLSDTFGDGNIEFWKKGDKTERWWSYDEGVTLKRTLNIGTLVSTINKCYNKGIDIDIELLKIYFELKCPKIWLGELYWDLFYIENFIHTFIKDELRYKYGAKEPEWWRKIPLSVRKECQSRREEDSNPEEPYNYTNLIDLKIIIDKQWNLFSSYLIDTFGDKKQFLSRFTELNIIRNKIMHPIKELPTLVDFFFAHEFYKDLLNVLKSYQPNY